MKITKILALTLGLLGITANVFAKNYPATMWSIAYTVGITNWD